MCAHEGNPITTKVKKGQNGRSGMNQKQIIRKIQTGCEKVNNQQDPQTKSQEDKDVI